MQTDVIIKNNITNSTTIFTAEKFEYLPETKTIKVYHNELGNVTVSLDENEELQINVYETHYDKYRKYLPQCFHATYDEIDDAIYCVKHGCNLGCGDAICEECGYREEYITEEDVTKITKDLIHGNYKMINNKIYTQNAFIIEREVKCK